MADLQPIQQSFESGEISPRLLGRTGTERYQTGLAQCQNFLPRSHGPAELRPGSEIIDKSGDLANDDDLRVLALDVNLSQTYAVTIGGTYVQVFDPAGPVNNDASGVELIYNPRFEGGLAGWLHRSAPEGDVSWRAPGEVVMTAVGDTQWAQIGQGFDVPNPAAAEHTLTLSILAFAGNDPAATVQLQVGPSFGDGTYLETTVTSGEKLQLSVPGPTATIAWVTLTVTATIAAPEQLWTVDDLSVREFVGAPTLARWASPYAGFSRAAIFSEPHPTLNALTLWHPAIAPYELAVTPAGAWTLAPIAFTSKPADWVDGNHPRTATFFQGRMWAGGTPDQPTRFWGSKSNDYYNFTGGTLPDDSVEFTISKKGAIAWLSGAKSLAIGTEYGEFIVTSESGVIQPGDIGVDDQSGYGSLAGAIVELGRQLIYVSPSETKLRVMSYQWTEDAWTSQDLAWASEHLPVSRIRELEFAAEPDQILWMVDRAGQMLSCSYNREQNIVGWARHPQQARVLSLAVGNVFGLGVLWSITRHDLPGVGPVHYLERQTQDQYLDASVTVRGTQIQDDIPGFDHLEGLTVRVIADGALHPDVVVTSGLITLQYPVNEVVAGRAFQGQAELLPLEGGNQAGTQQGVLKRYNRIFLQLNASVLPTINGHRPADRTPSTPMNTREPSRTGVVEVYSGGWDREARVLVVQDLPFATEITSLFGELQANKR